MFTRLLIMVWTALMGAVLGYGWAAWRGWRDPEWGALVGALVLSSLLWLLEFSRGLRWLRWLQKGDLTDELRLGGLWAEVAYRTRRLLQREQRQGAQAEQQLRNFLAAIQASPNGVILLDAQGLIQWCNLTAAQQLGIDPQRDLGQRIGLLLRDPGFTAYMQSAEPTQAIIMQGRTHRADRPVRISLQRHPYGEGQQMLLTRDITPVEQAEAMRRDFVANVSHEIRTPLTVLSGFVETLQTLELDEATRSQYLGLMAEQAGRMQSLVEDLLQLSRLEDSPLPDLHDAWKLLPWVESATREAQALSAPLFRGATPQQIRSVVEPALREAEILGDARELHSALSNLLSNAVRYTPAGGVIELHVMGAPEGGLLLQVRDSGPGIASEHLPRLTERFYRVDRSRSRETGGTGLGLAIVKHVMQRHQGELRVESSLGEGSRFSLWLPASRWRVAAPATAEPPQSHP